MIAIAVVLSTREPLVEDEEPERRRAEPTRQVDMVYLPPPPPEAPPPAPPPPPPPPAEPQPPQPTPQPSAPPPRERNPEPEDRANAPPEEVRSEGEETDEPEGASDPAAPPEAPRAEAPTMESEALRIFGRRRVATRPGAGPRAVRPLESYIPDQPDKCVPRQATPTDSAVPVQYGTVVGRIFRQDGGRPLAGAHLQMLGTPYVTFTDSEGEYQFRFDLSLMDNCNPVRPSDREGIRNALAGAGGGAERAQ